MFLLFCQLLSSVFSQESHLYYIPPSPFAQISVGFNESLNTFYFHSGLVRDGSYLLGLQRYYLDKTTNKWRFDEQGGSLCPDPRSSYGSFMYNSHYCIFGGYGTGGIYNDMWEFNTNSNLWSQVNTLTSISPRYSFASTSFVYQNTYYFAVLGGKSGQETIDLMDFHLYNIAIGEWTRKADYSACVDYPLSNAQIQYSNNKIYLFSGSYFANNTSNYYTGLCVYDLIKNSEWVKIPVSQQLNNNTQGGSASYNNFLYNFFGWSFVDNEEMSTSDVFRMNLSDNSFTWEKIYIEGCGDTELQRNSFGFWLQGQVFYILGGVVDDEMQNSLIQITLNNSVNILQCEVIYDNNLVPRRRNGASMVYVTGGFMLFGGMNQNLLFNDLWFLNMTSNDWTLLETLGSTPSPRYKHSAASQGNFIVVFGGITYNNVYLQDLYYYNLPTSTWSIIEPSSNSLQPPGLMGACLLINSPNIFIIGGKEEYRVTLNIWKLDITTLTFTLFYNYESYPYAGIYKHSCSYSIKNNNLMLYTYLGSINAVDTPFCGIYEFNTSQTPLIPHLLTSKTIKMPCRVEPAFADLTDGLVLFAGGQRNQLEIFSDIWIINLNTLEEIQIANLQSPVYASASTYINTTLYLYSGITVDGISSSSPSNNYWQKISLEKSYFDKKITCGPGMYYVDDICEFCLSGQYNQAESHDNCSSCPLGTYFLYEGATDENQCIPCSYGFKSNDPTDECSKCLDNEICYIGTGDNPLSLSKNNELTIFGKTNNQPSDYEPPNFFDKKLILYIVFASCLLIFCFVYALSLKLRIILSYYDIYKNLHFEHHSTEEGHEIPRDIINRPSKLGGFCSAITIIVLIFVAINTIMTYVETKTTEDIYLVPVDSLTKSHNFDNIDLKIIMKMASYRGNCTDSYLTITNSSNIIIDKYTIGYEGQVCVITCNFYPKEIVMNGDNIIFSFNQTFSYTSDVYFELNSDSSIDNVQSTVAQYIKSGENSVFRGADSTVFVYSVIPSYFKKRDSVGIENEYLGYRISKASKPIEGSTAPIENIPILSGLNIQLLLQLSDTGITTFKYPQMELFDFIVLFLNNFPGTVVVIGFLMWLGEYVHKVFTGKTSGRLRLAKKQLKEEIEEKKNKRICRRYSKNTQEYKKLTGTINE
ncbi:hypothetical protein SteCoe_18697 [Stentor coeruleus]|uniref:Tyrosine-protein kinase ephrin type A/B receptor-like domain-containing protein n=1 Tax=Stentor coeruleus TaxID=5963 RepID=A0A1R2BW26_9CILI|nr:hypothetical protein SteCoe_18697 [Stentor coeruleus]